MKCEHDIVFALQQHLTIGAEAKTWNLRLYFIRDVLMSNDGSQNIQ